jgi:hypothetical protein
MQPPSIAKLKSMGVNAFRVTASHGLCFHSAFVTFVAAGVDDQAPFPSITERRRFVYTHCGRCAVSSCLTGEVTAQMA